MIDMAGSYTDADICYECSRRITPRNPRVDGSWCQACVFPDLASRHIRETEERERYSRELRATLRDWQQECREDYADAEMVWRGSRREE